MLGSPFDRVVSDYRVLMGFRVPKGTKIPNVIRSKSVNADGGTGGVLKLNRDNTYASQLNRKAPHGPKFKYVGYSSQPVAVPNEAGFDSAARFKVGMKVPKSVVGKRFKVRPVLGSYQVSPSQPANDPISCGPDPFDDNGGATDYQNETWKICIDSPLKNRFRNISVKIRD